MNQREPIDKELGPLPESDLDGFWAAAETALAKDWLSPEEDAAWVDL